MEMGVGRAAHPPFQFNDNKFVSARRGPLSQAVRGYEARLVNHGLGAGGTQAGGLEIRPGLLRAVAAERTDIEPVGLRQRLRHAGLDLWGKSGKKGKGRGCKRRDSDR